MSHDPHNLRPLTSVHRRRGSIYIAVLGSSLMVVTLGLGAVLVGRAKTRTVNANNDVADARLAAQAGITLARKWIAADPAWRTTYVNGTWVSDLSLGRARVTIEGVDPMDGSLSNRSHDRLTLTATGKAGQAVYKLRATFTAQPVALPVMSFAAHTGGLFRTTGDLEINDATVSTNGALKNDDTIEGNASVATVTTAGRIWGTLVNGVAAKAMPDGAAIAEQYAVLGTTIPTTSIDKQVISPTSNPWGTENAAGVYVIRSSSDVKFKRSRLYGTLVVICPGQTFTIEDSAFMQPARADYPALIVVGNVIVKPTAALSESSVGANFNPAGTPYAGVVDSDQTDVYPNELQGLIHCTGTFTADEDVTYRGAIISEATGNSTATMEFKKGGTIVYDASMQQAPPQWYTSQVKMVLDRGSYQQIVD